MGPQKVVEAAVAAGIPEDTPGLNANAVVPRSGTASVHNIDMANAYCDLRRAGRGSRRGTRSTR